MNPRPGAAFRPLAQGLGDLPLAALFLAITQGEPFDYRPGLLERAIVESADAHRTSAGWCVTRTKFHENGTLDVVRDGDEYRAAGHGEEPHGSFRFGPGPVGGFLRFTLRPERIEQGRSAAPEVARAFRFADRRLGTDFGPLGTARDVR